MNIRSFALVVASVGALALAACSNSTTTGGGGAGGGTGGTAANGGGGAGGGACSMTCAEAITDPCNPLCSDAPTASSDAFAAYQGCAGCESDCADVCSTTCGDCVHTNCSADETACHNDL